MMQRSIIHSLQSEMSNVKNAHKHHLRVRHVCGRCDWLMQQERVVKKTVFISQKSNRNPLHNPADSPETSNNCREGEKHAAHKLLAQLKAFEAIEKAFGQHV